MAYGVSNVAGIALKALIYGVMFLRNFLFKPIVTPKLIAKINEIVYEDISNIMELPKPLINSGKCLKNNGMTIDRPLNKNGSIMPKTSVNNS